MVFLRRFGAEFRCTFSQIALAELTRWERVEHTCLHGLLVARDGWEGDDTRCLLLFEVRDEVPQRSLLDVRVRLLDSLCGSGYG